MASMLRPRSFHRLLALLVCLTTLAGAPLASVAATGGEPACAMAGMDSPGSTPCEGCGEQGNPSCVQQCAPFHAAAVLLPETARAPLAIPDHRIAPLVSAVFRSYAGPPGRQPPR